MPYFGASTSICTFLVQIKVRGWWMTALLFVVVHRLLQSERTAIFIQKALGYPEPSFGWDHPLGEFDQFFLAQ
jgi:hypothetical protein